MKFRNFLTIIFCILPLAVFAETPKDVFVRVWAEAETQIYPKDLSSRFTKEKYLELEGKSKSASNLDEIKKPINDFLLSLGVSHTQFYTDSDLEYYFLKSLFDTRDIRSPAVEHIGALFIKVGVSWRVRCVLDGLPAAKVGLKRGDNVIMTADGAPFDPIKTFRGKSGKIVNIVVQRGNRRFVIKVRPIQESPHFSLLRASKNSVHIYNHGGKKIGYFHLWSGTDKRFVQTLVDTISDKFLGIDGMILDLRDGFGGAWYDYLDPFFETREGFFKSTTIDRNGKTTDSLPGERTNVPFFGKPLVVLINEGVRSGKESLAYQFKKSKRATLVGTRTAGAFVGGKGVFAKEAKPYILFLSVSGMLLDGNIIEGVGIAPDIKVEYPIDGSPENDPQLAKALEIAFGQ